MHFHHYSKDFMAFYAKLHFILNIHTPALADMCGHTHASAINNIVLIFQGQKRNQDSTRKVLSRRIYLSKKELLYEKGIIEEKGETHESILPIKKIIVPLHTF